MNSNSTIKYGVLCLFIAAALIIGCNAKKESAPLKPFKINIEKVENLFVMKCIGCAWTNLSFESNNQAVNEYGMTELEDEESDSERDEKLADFLFVIERTEEGARMKGLKGTAWSELTFDLSDTEQVIDQSGIIKTTSTNLADTPAFVRQAIQDAQVTETVEILKDWKISDAEIFGSEKAKHRALILRGKNDEGNHTLTKIAIDKDNKVISLVPSESCIGHEGCRKCEFSPDVGCENCAGVACNHKITKTS